MRQFLSLASVLFKARYNFRGLSKKARAAGGGSQKSDRTWIMVLALGILFVPVIILAVFGIAAVTPGMQASGALTELMLLFYIVVMLIILIFGIINMLSYVYFNRDAEFLASLPVSPWKIFLCKLFIVYISEIALSLIFIIPVNLTIGIVSGQGVLFYLGTLLSVILVPALPVLLASILAIPLMFIVSFFRNRGAVTSIAVLLLFGGVFAAYYYFYFQILKMPEGGIENPLAGLIAGIASLKNVFYPVTALIRFCLSESVFGLEPAVSALVNILIVIGCYALMLLAAGIISNIVYQRSVISQSSGAKKKSEKAAAYKNTGVLSALMVKEWRSLLRESAFAFQCLSGLVIGPIITVVFGLQFGGADLFTDGSGAVTDAQAIFNANFPVALLIFVCVFACAGMNVAACSAISREGKNFYITKIMPVPYKQQIKAKLYIGVFISLAASFISAVTGVILMKLPFWQFFLIFGFLAVYCYTFACFAVRFDLKKPRLSWSTPNEAVKNTRSSTVPILINMLIGILLMGVAIVFMLFGLMIVMWIVLYLAVLGFAWLFHRMLFKNLDRAYEAIEV